MFRVTFLGHQGWMFASGESTILVDPLLTDQFGHDGLIGRVWPPRRIDLARFPRLDCVVFTHEHEDHFTLAALERIAPEVPIAISSRSSNALRAVLATAGRRIMEFSPGRPLQVGDLRYVPLQVDNVTYWNSDEWDVFPYLVHDVAGHGNFYTTVDVQGGAATEAKLRELIDAPGVWCITNNATDRSCFRGGRVHVERPPMDTAGFALQTLEEHRSRTSRWREPEISAICGGGWSFEGEREWLNRRVFPVDSDRVARGLQVVTSRPFVAPTPGQTFAMERGRLVAITNEETFLGTLPQSEWHSRIHQGSDGDVIDDYGPVCGRRDWREADQPALVAGLSNLARFLYAKDVFAGLHSLRGTDLAGRKGAVGLLLRSGDDESLEFAYHPHASEFQPADSDDPYEEYALGFECWATDLLAMFNGEITMTPIMFGAHREWNNVDERTTSSAALSLWMFDHPLLRPASYGRLYSRLWSKERGRSGGTRLQGRS